MKVVFSLTILAALALLASAQRCGVTPSNSSTCPNQQSNGCCNWQAENPNNQTVFADHSTNFTTDRTCRPLGFLPGTWYYQKDPSIAQPCITITCQAFAAGGQCSSWAGINVQTNGSLCVEFELNGVAQGSAACGSTAFSHCQQIPGSSSNRISIKFYCAQGCGARNVDFWYRVIQFTPTNGQDANDLCADLPSTYPDSLIQIPGVTDPSVQNPTIPTATTSAATLVQPTTTSPATLVQPVTTSPATCVQPVTTNAGPLIQPAGWLALLLAVMTLF